MIKIFALGSHLSKDRTGGVDFARIVQPMRALQKHKDFKVKVYDATIDETMDWMEVAKNHDLIYFNYTANPWEFAKMGALARHYKRPLVLDLDDNLWNVQNDNPAYPVFHKGTQALQDFTAICNEVDYITTTNLYLKHVIVHNTKKKHQQVRLFPNYIDLDLYSHRSPFKDDGQIQLLHFGSTTHFIDLQTEQFEKGVDKLFKEYPNVTIKTVGAMIPRYKYKWGQRYSEDFGDRDIYKWVKEKFPKFMDETDIIVVPLNENTYTRCKSNIKYLEASSAGKPGVYQNLRQYSETITNGADGFLAGDSEEWYQSLKKLIDNPKLRKSMGQKAFKLVEKDWQMKDHIKEYAKFFKEVVDKQ